MFSGFDLGSPDTGSSGSDAGPLELGGSDSTPLCPGGEGCACTENTDCDNDLCLETRDGKFCARYCVDSCPTGLSCAIVTLKAGDNTPICLDKAARLCDPCGSDADCQTLGLAAGQAVCVDQGAAGHFCGIPCSQPAECPSGYTCADVTGVSGKTAKQCQRLPDVAGGEPGACPCSKVAAAKGLSTTCASVAKDASGKVVGQCPGTRSCSAQGLQNCQAPAAAVEKCDGQDNDCNGLTDDAACEDTNPCTADLCKDAACSHSPFTGPCDADGNACTVGDACQDGACTPGKAKNCDDQNPCTVDSCAPKSGCVQVPDDGAPCSDDNPCSVGDLCQAGQCSPGKPKLCSSGDPCVDAKCSLIDGNCKYTPKLGCVGECPDGLCADDGNPCTSVACVQNKCLTSPLNGACKVDGNSCNPGTCAEGQCQPTGAAKNCDDANPCTNDGCDASTGACSHSPNSAPCSDGNACSAPDQCSGGKCAAGKAICKLGDPCSGAADCAEGLCIGGVCAKPAVSCGTVGKAPTGALGSITFSAASVIDTDTGSISSGAQVLVAAGTPGVFEVQQPAVGGFGTAAPAILVFDFADVTVLPGVVVAVKGKRALALLAANKIALQGSIVAKGGNGTAGSVNVAGSAGPAGPGGWAGGGFANGGGCSGANGAAQGPGAAAAASCGQAGGTGGDGQNGAGGGGGGGSCGGGGGGGGGRAGSGESGLGGSPGSQGSSGNGYQTNPGGSGGSACVGEPSPSGPSAFFGSADLLIGGSGGAAGGFGQMGGSGGKGKSSKDTGYGGLSGYAGGAGGGGGGGGAVMLCAGASITLPASGAVDVSGGQGGSGGSPESSKSGSKGSVLTSVPTGGGGGGGRGSAGGGGGGGAGGIAQLISPSLLIQGSIVASGGTAGSGGFSFGSGGSGGPGVGGGSMGGTGGSSGAGGKGGLGGDGYVYFSSSNAQNTGIIKGKLVTAP